MDPERCGLINCPDSEFCSNERCVMRESGAACTSRIRCGRELECSSATLTCEYIGCSIGTCAEGLVCKDTYTCQMENRTYGKYCVPTAGLFCEYQSECGYKGKCGTLHYCEVYDFCNTTCDNSGFGCVNNLCLPHDTIPCATDADCHGTTLFCNKAIGWCGRN